MAGNQSTGLCIVMEKCIIVAVADNGAIGINGTMPWHISEELKYFKKTTMGCPVIMGRTTFESLGKALPGRKNIVLTSRDIDCEGVVKVSSFEEAFAACEDVEKCFVIGGASVYAKLVNQVDRLYITEVHTTIVDADAYFPKINCDIWREISRSVRFRDEKSGLEYEFVVYDKK